MNRHGEKDILRVHPGLTLRQELEAEIAHLEKVIANKREMLALLDRNKDIERFMDLSRGL